ncbi:MAG: hypothetical protein ACXWEY_05720 [Bacteroidia bacterium]
MATASYNLNTDKELAEEKKNQRKALLMTIGIYSLLLLLILFLKMYPPDPPLPQAEGMEVILGEDLTGMNPVFDQPAPAATQPQPQQEVVEPTPPVKQPEAVKYETSNDKTAPTVKETPKEVIKEQPKVEPKPRQSNKNYEFEETPGTGKTEGGTNTSKGTGNQSGNQGDPDGNKDARNWEGQGKGNTGPGFDLAGRSAVSLPQPEGVTNQGGIVVVAIEVDQNGNVVSVRGGVRGSTTTNASLIAQAERAAKKAKFSANPTAPEIQSGTIRYNFQLQ